MAGKFFNKLKDYFLFALIGIRHRKVRSWLTILGIFIGIAAVVGLVSISEGMQNAITQEFSSLGADRVLLQPGSAFFGPPGTGGLAKITKDDIEVVEQVRGVKQAGGFVLKTSTKAEFNDKTKFVYGIGIPTDETIEVFGSRFAISEGREFKQGDKNRKVAIAGYAFAKDDSIFGKTVRIGDTVIIDDEELKIVGIRENLGDPGSDLAFLIPLDVVWDIYGDKDEFSIISMEIDKGFVPSEVAERVKIAIRKDRNQEEGDEDFQVQTSEELFASFAVILNVVQAVIIGIAGISLLVGSIGIMNTMYTSVIERTKEIGVMKAVGATNADIMLLFVIESGIYGFIGGTVGVLLGIGMAKGIEFAAAQSLGEGLLVASTNPTLIIGALALSFILGAISGVAPARQAAGLKPVDALRYE
jgi:putative ABC transport system permease protein